MSDRPGLSIFDDDPADDRGDNGSDDATQVIPAVKTASGPAAPGPQRPAPQAAQSNPAPTAGAGSTGTPSTPHGGARPTFPVVRRGGYDTAAVDRQMHTLAGEKAGLTASLNDAKQTIAALEKQVASLETTVSREREPDLRRSRRPRQRDAPPGRGAGRRGARSRPSPRSRRSCAGAHKDAETLKAQAARDAEDMRMVQLKELDEARARALAEIEQERSHGQGRGRRRARRRDA